tara:strand:+ start:37627 stop:38148 length:522 start_codon:yes stop_codon:yes gene_type:complete
MTNRLSLVIAWSCTALLVLVPLFALYFLTDLASLADFVRHSMGLPIRWQTVSDGQWYAFWGLTAMYLSIGLAALYFLRRAFVNFARGEFFNMHNSRDLRRFSILLLVQAIATPVHFMASSVLLSLHHPAGQKVLSVSFNSNEFRAVGVALVLWVISNLLVEGCRLQTENQQFV